LLSTAAVDYRVVRRTGPTQCGRSIRSRAHNRASLRPRKLPEDALISIIQAAGWPIWPLILCSVVALTIIIERLVSLRPAQIAPNNLLEEVVAVTRSSLPGTDIVNKLAANSLLGSVFATGLRSVIAEPRISEEAVRQSFESAGRIALHRLERYLNTLGTIAAAAPLLGLFGTVIGMIEIFGSQTASASNPIQLAHGISIALYNTAMGLIVAIPSMIFYRHFRAKVDALVVEMEQQAIKLVDFAHGERK
jgi:biopolymer transport protein ExbB